MKLEEIGFYTLSDNRARCANSSTPLSRCELVLTSRRNFNCPYCRRIGGEDMKYEDAANIVKMWAKDGLKNIRFSGGEPTLYNGILELVSLAKDLGIERIAISSNGSARQEVYQELIYLGVNDFSISLDACCAEDGDKMSGGIKGSWNKVIKNIKFLSERVYTTVGVVLTDDNIENINDIIKFADSLNVSDIRVIPAAQKGQKLNSAIVDDALLNKYPILKYRINNMNNGLNVRGLKDSDSKKCGLVLDDMAINHNKHYPCIIYMRESGKEIGELSPNIRKEREEWYKTHNTHEDKICKMNCLDVCVQYNNNYERFHNEN